ncbi:hypothetical protein [Glutamicibacter sp. TV12E]|uniref:hypothetical protein n=1 Tax=Glutamicibacter sp. TV12E TaxID=3446362 RepID=UPI004034475E
MSELTRIHNPQAEPVIYTQDGKQLDGFTSVTTDITDPITAALLECGRLIIPKAPTGPPSFPKPKAAKTTTKEETANE